jgi:thioredoxin 2
MMMDNSTATRATVACPSCGKLNRIDLSKASLVPKCGACGSQVPVDRPVTIDDRTMEKVVTGTDVPVLVDFYADWCGPCKAMAPQIEELARAHSGRAVIAKLDTDQSPQMAGRFGIRGIPTLIVFRNGREVAREVGGVPRAALESLLQRAYAASS